MAQRARRSRELLVSTLVFTAAFGLTALLLWKLFVSNPGSGTQPTANFPSPEELAEAATPQSAKKPSGPLKGTRLEQYAPPDRRESIADIENFDIKIGDGAEVAAHDTVEADYIAAAAATGIIYESSLDTGQSAVLVLDTLVPGWRDGMIGMKEGGTRRLYLTAPEAYGANPPAGSGLPENAEIVIEVTLRKVQKP